MGSSRDAYGFPYHGRQGSGEDIAKARTKKAKDRVTITPTKSAKGQALKKKMK